MVFSKIPHTIKVLLVDDSLSIALKITHLLKESKDVQFEVEHASNLSLAFERIARGGINVIILDLGLPDSYGLDTFFKMHEKAADIPTVVFTGMADEEIALEALRHGAQDYLVKTQFDERLLTKALRYAIERKISEEKIRESEEKYRTLFETVPDIVCQLNLKGRITFVNSAISTLGFRPEELINRHISYIVHPEDLPLIEEQTGIVFKERSGTDPIIESIRPIEKLTNTITEMRYRTKWEEEVPVSFSCSLIKNKNGQAEGVVGIARDMREMRKLILDLKRSRDELQARTAQLVQTEKMTAIGGLTAGIAHEMNQPLNAIKITCGDVLRDIVKGRFDPNELKGGLEEVIQEIDNVADLVDHLRVFSINSPCTKKEKVPVRVPVDGVLKILGQQLVTHGIHTEIDINPALFVIGDAMRLEQVFMNLIINARDAIIETNRKNDKQISISTRFENKEGNCTPFVVYEIADNGVGIAQCHISRVFDPFFTTKDPGYGTGLGLSIAQQIVNEHGGRIEVESKSQRGSVFRVYLPTEIR